MAETVDSEVLGRDEELDRLGRLLDERAELPAALVVDGEAGIGKTTLWRWAIDRARDRGYRTLVCRPGGAEAGLSYAALGDLLGGALDDALPALPPPQRRALAFALLLEDADGPPPDARAIGVAVLGALRTLAADGPVLVAIDDLQWLDGATAAALGFALGWLRGEPVATLAARRLGLADGLELAGAERLAVGPLSIGATHRLLTSLGASFPRPVLVQVHEASGGNPFFALELGRARLRREAEPGTPAPLPDDLAGLVRERLAGLPGEATAAAALLASPTVADVVRACGGRRSPVDAAVEAGVLELDGDRVRFTHPLLAAGAEAGMWPPERRALHGRLASIVSDPEERARHLALAADGPETGVATALDEAARFAAARGAAVAAAELASLAVRSTPAADADELRRRRIEAAELHVRAGDIAAARSLLEPALVTATGAERARPLFRLAQTASDPGGALDILDEAVAAGPDGRLLAEIELDRVAWLHGVGGIAAARPGARAAVAAARRAEAPILLASAISTSALIDVMAGERIDPEPLREAVATEATDPAWPVAAYPPSVVLGMFLQFADRLDEARDVLDASVTRSAARGDEIARHQALLHLAETEIRACRYDRAATVADEGLASAEQTGYPQPKGAMLYVRALADTYRGRVDSARAAANTGLAIVEKVGDLPFALQHRGGLGFLELSLGDFAAADELLRPLWSQISAAGYGDPSVLPVLPNAIEAMLRVGERDEAEAQLAELERHGARLDSPWSLSQAARCRALLADDADAAEEWFERALAEHERMPGLFERGRTLLARGAARRRARRRGAARESVLAALAIFEELGAPLWAAQARAELVRLGGRGAAGGLTPTERHVAELAASGLSTKQVAAALVVSPKTVEGHLSRIYAKLGVRSRAQLAGRLR